MKNLNGKVAAVTGAGSGIGQALAVNLAQEGCALAISDVNEKGLKETQNLLKGFNVKVTSHALDVADKEAVYAWADKVVEDHGKVNLIFNNAGVALSGTVDSLSIEDYEWIMNINFWGVVYGTKAFLPHLEASGEGHVVNISSIFGLTSQPLMSGYNASKFAVRGFTESLRQDLEITGSKVSTTCIHPGGIKTNIAQSARVDKSSMKVTGATKESTLKEFEKMFVHTPDSAAKTILKGVKRNDRRVLIGADAKAFDGVVRLFPTGYQWLFTKAIKWRSKAAKKFA
ncbi:short-chain dehydrogenase [Oleiphilus sp. HI0081]|nr:MULTISPECIES: SDR family NAD(P)-dependent oxidoreductase [unclassified Oleiphilus]KZY41008.1 short-chain dehydrogenase [Oleiphilus sp. HI0050]KZY80154.1 short-chain dehydrogenase [Oleiphilus sp. HI0068]KZY81811.1 short-chain dehydrogenase [Oleiphilus sp. HI0069]KZY87981.1 short-chain dehydrogenase [Oleiphilus sp. HI0072]KZZ18806.1 short-chain dehydrogenase [Oleiphilus sp. HI0081]KZZ20977.1 short-chain dehydrogenase [Oleiphilus sp. HI0078]KZZ31670.1 short-chain dehydrogenase [Oleiphilus sp